jgi:uncharacterized protein (DUF2344 family)
MIIIIFVFQIIFFYTGICEFWLLLYHRRQTKKLYEITYTDEKDQEIYIYILYELSQQEDVSIILFRGFQFLRK